MSPGVGFGDGFGIGFPRVSGDEPLGSCGGSQEPEFSPRERG